MSDARKRPRSRPASRPSEPTRRTAAGLVATLTLLAAILRIVWLDRSPPGPNQDEAINAWNAYSLLKTGVDTRIAQQPELLWICEGEL